MSSGSSINGGSSAATKAKANAVQVVEDSYIVTLLPNLAKKVYEDHLKHVYELCQGFKTNNLRDACIEMVFSEPIDARIPTSVYYFALFPVAIADQVRRLESVVSNIHQERAGSFDIAGTHLSSSPNWGLASISHPVNQFYALYNAFENQLTEQPGPFAFNALPSRGENSTVYVIDSGYKGNTTLNGEFLGPPHVFINAVQYRSILEENVKSQAADTPWLPSNWCTNWKGARLAATHGHAEADDLESHGTNVSLFVGSSMRGTAARAEVVTIRAVNEISKLLRVAEKNILHAMQIINDRSPGCKTVVNCSWSILYDTGEDVTGIIQQFNELQGKGVTIVTSAGNSKKSLMQKGATVNEINNSLVIPSCLSYAYIVGSHSFNGRRSDFSNYIAESTVGSARPPNRFIWAPGEKLPGFERKPYVGPAQFKLEYQSGTSFSAPLFSGAIACLLASLPPDEKLDDHLDELVPLLKFQAVKGCGGSQEILQWHAT